MYKSELATLYDISTRTLARLMNFRYFTELEACGYVRHDQLISPAVIRRFYELYGKPLTKEENEE